MELSVPSILGFDRVAMDCAASIGRLAKLPQQRVEDLKMAVGEACLNAIEHGNKRNAHRNVGLTFTMSKVKLQVEVRDHGKGIGRIKTPNIDAKMTGKETLRGWGVFLMRNLMDEVHFESPPEGGTVVKMIIHLGKASLRKRRSYTP